MKKKGFTLVEIIVVIALIAFIGTISFFGIRLINKNIKENKLRQIEDKILTAAEIYIETNKEVKNKVNDQGAIIPLNVLHNEGLINLDGIIDKNDDDYVVALLGGSIAGEECESTYIEGSWKIGSKTIYICTKNDGSGGSNLSIINPESLSNYNKVTSDVYYFRGINANNYAKFKKNSSKYLEDLRIMSVDTDDSITVLKDFGNPSNECSDKWSNYIEENMSFTEIEERDVRYYRTIATITDSSITIDETIHYISTTSCGGLILSKLDYLNTFITDLNAITFYDADTNTYRYQSWLFSHLNDYGLHLPSNRDEYLHLKPCIKIISGTGAQDNPYILEKKGTC